MRSIMFGLLSLIYPVLLLALCLLDTNQCSADGNLPILAKRTAVITDRFGLSLVADIDLGLLPRSTRGIIEISLVNNSSDTVRIDRVHANCGCLSSRALSKSIEPGQQGDLEFTLDTPNVAATKEIRLAASLLSGEQTRDVRLAMKYLIEGVLAFESRLCVIELNRDDESQAFESKIFCTDPVFPDEIEISADPVFANIKFEISTKGNQPVLTGILPLNTISGDEIAGRVVLKHVKTNQTASMDLILRKTKSARISPSLITLRRSDAQQPLQGSAILHLDNATHSILDSNKPLVIDADSRDLSLKVTSKQLTQGVYKLKISSLSDENHLSEVAHRPIDVTLNLRNIAIPMKLSSTLIIEK